MTTRREMIRQLGSGAAALGAFGLPWPALAQGEQVVPFTDMGAPVGGQGPTLRRLPSLETFLTPVEEFFAVQHYPVPTIDAASYRLRIGGLVERPMELSMEDIRKRAPLDQVVGFECSGNTNARGNPLVGNARWGGTSVAALLKAARPLGDAREVVFFSADRSTEEVSHGGAAATVDQHFARSLALEEALRPEVVVAHTMNGQPLSLRHGAPLRLIVPGWYGVANVKWLDRIHVQDSRFMGKYMARDYVTLRGVEAGADTIWNESSVSRVRLKSAIGRVTRTGTMCRITGFALTDGTPLRAVEVRIDGGAWRPAQLWKENTPYSWKLFTLTWPNAPAGAHTMVSRAIDVHGRIQPERDDPAKKTRWENNVQFVRTVTLP